MESAGVSNPQRMLQNLASMGSDGQHAYNVHRDLIALTKDTTQLPQPLHVHMPLKTKAKVALQAVMLPQLVFHSLWVHYKDYWDRCFLPNGTAGLLHFWNHFENPPQHEWALPVLQTELGKFNCTTRASWWFWAHCWVWQGLDKTLASLFLDLFN